MAGDRSRLRAARLLEHYIDTTLEGFLANADALESDPTDPVAGDRLRDHLADLERLVSVRNGLFAGPDD